jgi:hypothetical protein
MKVNGIEFGLSSFEHGLWYDDDKQCRDFAGWGIKVAVVWGPLALYFPKVWKYSRAQVWAWLMNNVENPLTEQFGVTIPIFLGPYLSIAYKRIGLYIGFKSSKELTYLEPTARFTTNRRF